MIEPTPTKRAMVDVGRQCNINCKFCYYTHLGDLRKQGWATFGAMCKLIDLVHARGNNYIDFTGGEPTIYPQMLDLIKHATKRKMKTCIVTNGLCGEARAQKLIDAGLDDFLVSLHGLPDTHDFLTDNKRGWIKLNEFIDFVKGKINFRYNFVINKYNQNEILGVAEYMALRKPSIVNFINVNPYRKDWQDDKAGTKDVIADLRKVEPMLNAAIEHLEERSIGVNVRYYPMCRIADGYRRCVCNDLHVAYDPYEWDYPRHPKTMENFRTWSAKCSMENEEKGEPCCRCGIRYICGGVNRNFNAATNGKAVDPIIRQEISEDFYHYRRFNDMTLSPPGANNG